MHIMVVPSWYSSETNKVHGSFFKEQFKALQNSGEKISVAYNEIWPITMLGRMKQKRGISFQIEDELRTYRYKDYNFLPKNPKMFNIFNKRMEKLYLEILKKEGKIDVIHAHSSFWGGISAAYVAKKYGVPFVLTEHSSLKNSQYVKESYIPYIKESYNTADRLIAVGNGLKKEMIEYTSNDIDVIHNLIDFSTFKPKSVNKDESKLNLFSLAYLVEGKGMESLIRAYSKAFKKDDNVILRIGGDGDKKEALNTIIDELGLNDRVVLLGALSRDEVVNEVNRCDGFVLASEHETFGVVYIEALAVGKPVLGTYNGGAEDIIKEYNGIIVENKNEEALLKGLKDFKEKIDTFNKDLIIKECKNNYSEDVIVKKLKEVYNAI